jgi:hypothetical protein
MFEAIIIRKIRANLREIKRNRDFITFDKIQSVCITYEASDFEKAKVLETSLIAEGKECLLFGYNDSKTETFEIDEGYVFSRKETNFLCFPNQTVVDEFKKQASEKDLLIDISDVNHLSSSYLNSLSKSKLKVGIQKKEFDLYDLIIDVPKNFDSKFLSQQIMFYLRKLKSQR